MEQAHCALLTSSTSIGLHFSQIESRKPLVHSGFQLAFVAHSEGPSAEFGVNRTWSQDIGLDQLLVLSLVLRSVDRRAGRAESLHNK